jgi:outer membrane protein OmpA-like peptidoglycan-associated protein
VTAASEPVTAASEPPPIVVNIGGIKLVNGRVDYTDHFVRPNYSAALTELNGALGAFSSTTRDMAALQLHGRAEGTAILDISGQVNPLARPLALDIEARATDLELAPLSPYAGNYAGYAIERGKLSMDVAYKIAADGRLEARNQVTLNQLTFGNAIESPTATKLPVRLAVALLKDRNGVIDINLPISGSVNDPQFSVGGIVVKLIVNLLVKAVTSPFSLLSGSGDSSGLDMSAIEFKPGTAVVTGASAAALDKVATALTERPSLQMTITGSADPQAERAAWQRESMESQLRAMARDDALRSGAAASAPSAVPAALSATARSALLKTLYKQTRLPDKPRNLVGMARGLPDAEMEAMLARNVSVNDEAMRQQALARAIAVRDALIAKGIPTDRLFLAAPSLHAAGADATPWTPRATLALEMP